MTIQNGQFDCGLRLIGHLMGGTAQQRCARAEIEVQELKNQNKESYIVSQILCTFLRKSQETEWKYFVDKLNFQQVTNWQPSKTRVSVGVVDELATFVLSLPDPKNTTTVSQKYPEDFK